MFELVYKGFNSFNYMVFSKTFPAQKFSSKYVNARTMVIWLISSAVYCLPCMAPFLVIVSIGVPFVKLTGDSYMLNCYWLNEDSMVSSKFIKGGRLCDFTINSEVEVKKHKLFSLTFKEEVCGKFPISSLLTQVL